MPKTTNAKRAGYTETVSSPCTTPQRHRHADARRAGKRDLTYRPTAAERLLASSAGYESPEAERKERREVRREVDALLDVHRRAPARDGRYVPTKAELERDMEEEAEDAARERRARRAPRRLKRPHVQVVALEQGLLKNTEGAAVSPPAEPTETASQKASESGDVEEDEGEEGCNENWEDNEEGATTPRENKDKGCILC